VQASIVPCHENLLAALRGEAKAETTGEDNLKTVQLVFASYESARSGKVSCLSEDHLREGVQ
jgi:D-apiose dehydrogenase